MNDSTRDQPQPCGPDCQEYNEKKVFNIKIAAEVTKAFHEIEISGGWLKRSAGNKGNIR